jgi:hypothetical protein
MELCDVISNNDRNPRPIYKTVVTTRLRNPKHDIVAGQVVGTVTLLADGKHVGDTDAVASAPVALKGAWMRPGTPVGKAIHAGTIIVRAAALILLALVILLVGLSLHGRAIAKNSRRRRASLEEDVRAVDS